MSLGYAQSQDFGTLQYELLIMHCYYSTWDFRARTTWRYSRFYVCTTRPYR